MRREEGTIQTRFESFHDRNPDVYVGLCKLARGLKRKGYSDVGIGMLWEVLRYRRHMETDGREVDGFKLSNTFRSRYARLIMDQEPDLAGFFSLRELRST